MLGEKKINEMSKGGPRSPDSLVHSDVKKGSLAKDCI